ncbi:MAG: serine--tRNA ligase [Actinomycetota bacterium]|nr:serine--tRNA ligase [Actinomycetota bacterium]
MIDIRALRENFEETADLLSRRGLDITVVKDLYDLDSRLRRSVADRDQLRGEVNELSRQVGEAFKAGQKERGEELRSRSKELGERLEVLTAETADIETQRRDLWLVVPNLPDPEAPLGLSEDENVIRRYWTPEAGQSETPPTLDFPDYTRKPHWEIGKELDILDLERGAKLSGSMFPMYKGLGSRLLRALTSFALDQHSDAFLEIHPPTFVKTETMISTGHLPKFGEEAYHIEKDDLWAIPTAEVPLTSMARDEIIDGDELPIRMTASTPCFRREAGSAGRDTRGLLRLHEFDKVELMVYAKPEQSQDVFADMLSRAEGILRSLGLTYRVLDLCTGDIGQSSRRTFDLEVYSPGVDRWLEASSVSWCGDYQARRANIRYRDEVSGEIHSVHTLNGSALAWARIFAVLIEVNRQEDGSVRIPKVLQPYLGGTELIRR